MQIYSTNTQFYVLTRCSIIKLSQINNLVHFIILYKLNFNIILISLLFFIVVIIIVTLIVIVVDVNTSANTTVAKPFVKRSV